MHTIIRHVVCAFRLLREFFCGASHRIDFTGSTLSATPSGFYRTRIRRRDGS